MIHIQITRAMVKVPLAAKPLGNKAPFICGGMKCKHFRAIVTKYGLACLFHKEVYTVVWNFEGITGALLASPWGQKFEDNANFISGCHNRQIADVY